jgi:hypothetical protein
MFNEINGKKIQLLEVLLLIFVLNRANQSF